MRQEDTANPVEKAEKNDSQPVRPFQKEEEHPWIYSQPPSPPPGRFTPTTKKFFTAFTLLLCAAAVVFEATLHPAAGIFQLDPIPNLGVLALYVLTVCTIGVNHAVLNGGADGKFGKWRESPRVLNLLTVSTVISIMVALSASYMFLPLAPFGGLLILFAGLGFLLLTPFFALISLCLQLRGLVWAWRGTARTEGELRRTVGASTLAAVGLFAWLIGIPIAAAHYTERALRSDNREDFAMLRRLNSEGVLLDIAYRRKPNYWTCLGFNAHEQGWWPTSGMEAIHADTDSARRAYFLVTGKPFEQVPRPMSYRNNAGNVWFSQGAEDVAIEETGGFLVGRKVPGLSLMESRMDGSTDDAVGAGTVEWTMVFRNDTDQPQEARADILLPNDAVVSKVSLWINGVEQPARYGHPDRVRAAYQDVAVVQKRDPLLVTMPAPGHVLAQCFPVPARGNMKIKLGFALATQTEVSSQSRLLLPALGMVNFDVPSTVRHTLQTTGHSDDWSASELFSTHFLPLSASLAGVPRLAPTRVIVAIDASEGVREILTGRDADVWQDALNAIPSGSMVDLLFTDAPEKMVHWTPGQPVPRDFLNRAVVGGTDPEPALTHALQVVRADEKMPGAVLFVHAASPHGVSKLDTLRSELQQKYGDGPALVGIQVAPGAPDTLIKDLSGFPRVYTLRALPARKFFAETFRDALRFTHDQEEMTHAEVSPIATLRKTPAPSTPAERVALFGTVLKAWRFANALPAAKALDVRIEAGKAAAKASLVTPLSSAVVLETEAQYKKHGLEKDGVKDPRDDKPADMQNPATPEPGTLALASLGLLALPFLKRRR